MRINLHDLIYPIMPYNEIIHLAIAFDRNYLSPFYALITSILTNNGKHHLTVHAIISGLSETEKKEISAFLQKNRCEIHYYEIDDDLISRFVLTGKWTAAVYYRLFFPLLVPRGVKRLLYLDTDTLVLGDLQELYTLDLGSHPVGAIYDNWVKTAPYLGIKEEGDYFNSGVLLIDLEKWNFQKISEKAMEFLKNNPEKIKYVDQDALYAILIGNWQKLDQRYNLMYSLIPNGLTNKELDQFIKDKVILHFTLERPWFLLCKNRYRKLYYHFLAKSPAKNRRNVIDFSIVKIPALLKLRLLEFYFNSPVINSLWRKIKGSTINS